MRRLLLGLAVELLLAVVYFFYEARGHDVVDGSLPAAPQRRRNPLGSHSLASRFPQVLQNSATACGAKKRLVRCAAAIQPTSHAWLPACIPSSQTITQLRWEFGLTTDAWRHASRRMSDRESHGSTLPNTRLKLLAPVPNPFGCRPDIRCGRIPFLNTQAWAPQLKRISLGCVISVLAVPARLP